jgi:hypothetical protein
MKLNVEQKEIRINLLHDLDREEGGIFTYADVGVVIVVCPAVRGDAKFAHVAVAQCCPEDKFKRKQGELLALCRWNDGDVLRVPFNDRILEEVAEAVLSVLVEDEPYLTYE